MTTVFAAAFVSATLFIGCGSPFHPSRSDQHNETGFVVIIGTISSSAGRCPSASFEVALSDTEASQAVLVVTNPSTTISGRSGCSGLTIGTRVEVEGNQDQAQVTASRIVTVPGANVGSVSNASAITPVELR